MVQHAAPDVLPISALNTLEYCSRRFYYQFVQADTLVNDLVLEGTLLHQRVHQPGTHTVDGLPETTRLYLYSETLRLSGFADVIEERGGVPIPVEYKHGKQGQWLNDSIQLCAQALCLEERLTELRPQQKVSLSHGYIFYSGSHHRIQVPFTQELRTTTYAAIERAFQVAVMEQPPQPLNPSLAARCEKCSLHSLCLPDEVRLLHAQKKGV